jgi:hypothetical protein
LNTRRRKKNKKEGEIKRRSTTMKTVKSKNKQNKSCHRSDIGRGKGESLF